MFKSCLKSKDFYKSMQTSVSPAPSWVGKLNKFQALLFIICLTLNEGLLRGNQSPVNTVTMTAFHNWLKIIFHLTGVLVFTLNSCCFPICSLTEVVLIMTLDNEHPAGSGVAVLCSLNQHKLRPLQPLAVLWSWQCFDFPTANLVQRNRVSSHMSYREVSWSRLNEMSFGRVWTWAFDLRWDHAFFILDFKVNSQIPFNPHSSYHMDQ